MQILMGMFVASGVVLGLVSIPLILGRIPPNGLYGFRVRKTIENPEIWYPVNRYAGQRLLVASLVFVLSSIGLRYVPGLGTDIYSYAVLLVFLAGFAVALVSSIRYMNCL